MANLTTPPGGNATAAALTDRVLVSQGASDRSATLQQVQTAVLAPANLMKSATKTTAYTFALADAAIGADVPTMNSATASSFTIPTNAAVAFPLGTVLPFSSIGAGQTSILAAAGVTFIPPGPLALRAAAGVEGYARQHAIDTWIVVGDLA